MTSSQMVSPFPFLPPEGRLPWRCRTSLQHPRPRACPLCRRPIFRLMGWTNANVDPMLPPTSRRRRGGMVDATDLKSVARKGVPVRVRPTALLRRDTGDRTTRLQRSQRLKDSFCPTCPPPNRASIVSNRIMYRFPISRRTPSLSPGTDSSLEPLILSGHTCLLANLPARGLVPRPDA